MEYQYVDHEKLKAYRKSVEFVSWSDYIVKNNIRKLSVIDQLDRASTSMVLNIAEGNGKFTSKDRCHYFDIARGSALESSACLDVLFAKGIINEQEVLKGKEMLREIVSMIVGLIKSNSDRLFESDADYNESK